MTKLGFSVLKPAVRQTLANSVTDSLRAAILGRALKPGNPLPEAQLAVRLGVSRAPVREALVALAQEGLVTKSDGTRGMSVATLSRADVNEISSLRLVLESSAVRLIVRQRDTVDFVPLEEVVQRTRRAKKSGEAAELDVEFHEEMMRAAGHNRLLTSWLALRSQIRLLLFQMDQDDCEFARHTAEAHKRFVAILRAGSEADALRTIEQDLKNTHSQVAKHCPA